MPRKKRSRAAAASNAAAEPEVEESTEAGTEDEDEENATGNTQSAGSTGSSSRGPFLIWNRERDHALVEAVNEEMTSAEIVAHLTSHEAFNDLPEGAVTATKVTNRLSLLRGRGVEVPRLTRAGRYSPDVDELNDLLA